MCVWDKTICDAIGVITFLIHQYIPREWSSFLDSDTTHFVSFLVCLLLFKCEWLSGMMRVRVRNNYQEMSTGEKLDHYPERKFYDAVLFTSFFHTLILTKLFICLMLILLPYMIAQFLTRFVLMRPNFIYLT